MHRVAGCCFLVLLAIGSTLRAADPPWQIKVDQVDTSRFPQVTVRFRIVDHKGQLVRNLPNEEITIWEDGKQVHAFRPTGLKLEAIQAMLALDTSGSMARANKMPEAKAAAERFLARLDPEAACGLVLFNHQPYEVLAPERERKPLWDRIQRSQPSGGTAYLDAASRAIQQLADTQAPGRRAVVVLTDGRDVNSDHNLAQVIEEARENRVQVYTLGLGEAGRNEFVRTALVLDCSGSMGGRKMDALKQAAVRFVQLMPPQSADTTIIAFNSNVYRAGAFSSDRRLLQQAIHGLQADGETALYDAMYDGIETLNATRGGDRGRMRRAVIAFTDGRDTASRRREEDVIDRARQDEIKVYILGFGGRGDLNEPSMRRIAQETGGEFFPIRDVRQLLETFENLSIRLHDDGIDERSLRELAEKTGGAYQHAREADRLTALFERVASQLESTYAVAFRSGRDRHDGTLRGLDVRFGALAVGKAGYTTHGLITPAGDQGLYIGLLLVLGVLLAAPSFSRRLLARTESAGRSP